jgi:hypothetical protein
VDGIAKEGGLYLKSPNAQASYSLTMTSIKGILQSIELTLGGTAQ